MTVTDKEVAARVKRYWLDRGYDIRVEVIATIDKKLKSKLGDVIYRRIVSDLVNGLPRGYRGDVNVRR